MERRILAALALLGSCRDPTEITLEIKSDFVCGDSRGTTTISVAGDLGEITEPGTTTETCPTGHPNDLGTLVLVPSGVSDHVAVEIIAGIGKEACAAKGDPTG